MLDIPDIAHIVKYAGHTEQDASGISTYLWSLKKFKEVDAPSDADPFQLLDAAGYHAFEVHNLKEQNSIKRFFRRGESICTFDDDARYKENYMIHAIKKDVWRDKDAIKPSARPQRQDEYGTSVISIQIAKGGGFISIKNRYNHTVNHPDQTFNSNPDEIIPGLSAALKAHFNVDWISTNVNVPDGFVLVHDQLLKYNFEVNNYYIGDGFYTDNGDIIDIDRRNMVQMDYFIWDNQKKQLLNPTGEYDCFPDVFNKFIQGKKVTIDGKYPNQRIIVDSVTAIELENNQIVSLNLPGVTEIDDYFLYCNQKLGEISLPKVTTIGNGFLEHNTSLGEISLPKVTTIAGRFLEHDQNLGKISLPKVTTIGNGFLEHNQKLGEISLPKVTTIGNGFLEHNQKLGEISLPNVESIGTRFLYNNKNMTTVSLPMAKHIGSDFLHCNKKIKKVFMPLIEQIPYTFLTSNNRANLYMPNLKSMVSQGAQHNVKPAINVPITDIFPNRRNVVQGFKYAARKIYQTFCMQHRINADYEI